MNGEPKGPPSNDGEHRYDHYRLTGQTPQTFAQFRTKLMTWIEQILDTQVTSSTGTVRDEATNLMEGLLGFAKATLACPSVENERRHAEAVERFAAAKKSVAEARKADAIAERIEISNKIRKLLLALKMTKAMMVHDKSEDGIIFGGQIDALIVCLSEMKQDVPMLPGGEA